jgi:hypothetical protein
MSSENPKIYNPDWLKYADLWKTFSYPWRPNKKQISFCSKYLKKYLSNKRGVKVLILGSTPETRDLCSKLKLSVTCLEISESMYHGMKKLMCSKPYKEKLVLGKWEDVYKYFKNNEFDIIFGDETHCNMAISSWKKNLNDIRKIIKPDGLYFFSAVVMTFNKKSTFQDVMKKYNINKKYFDNYQNRIETFYQLCLGEDCYDWEKRGCVYHKLKEKFINYAKKNKISLEIINKIWPVADDIKNKHIGDYVEVDPPTGEVYEFLFPYFWIEDIYIDKSHPVYRFRRDIVLKPKK